MLVMFYRVCLFNNRSARLIAALLLVSSSSSSPLEAQTFTKIVAGAIVNDGSNSTGASWADYDGDGFLDLFVANGNLTPQNDLLYRNNRNGTFTQITGGNIVTDGGSSIGGTWGDYDNDGDADLFVANRQGENNFLYRNEGNGAFTKIMTGNIVTDGGNSNSSSWVDFDNDGDLDLYVINFNEADFLYRNDGAGTFTRITTGPPVTDISFSISGVWADYDNDGDQDLFISNGGNQNNFLYRNEGNGVFTKITTGAIVNDGGSAIGCSWGDYNNDGNSDLFVANFLGQNNFLYRNDGPPNYTFTKITAGVIVNDGGNSVGSVWGDIDNDGDLDLFVGDDGQNNSLYLNSGPPDYVFTKMTTGSIVNDGGNTFGVTLCDYDRDGDLDAFAANRENQNNFLYANNGNSNHWVNILCVGVNSNRSAIGAKIGVKANFNGTAIWQRREVAAQSGYNSQNGFPAAFGLGEATRIDSLIIVWPSRNRDTFVGIAVDQFLTITEGGKITRVEQPDKNLPEQFRLLQNHPNPFNPSTTISFRLPSPTRVILQIYDILGRPVKTLADQLQTAGLHSVVWDGTDQHERRASSGIYICHLQAGSFTQSQKMILVE